MLKQNGTVTGADPGPVPAVDVEVVVAGYKVYPQTHAVHVTKVFEVPAPVIAVAVQVEQ